MDYREYLSDAFRKRRQGNPKYSLRAFARDIGVSPSRLSEVMTGKGELSHERGSIIAKKIKLTALETLDFLDRIDAVSAALPAERQAATKRVASRDKNQRKSKRRYLDDEHFAKIFDPKFHVIWSLMQLPSYDGNPASITDILKINSIELYDSLRGLERLGLARNSGQTWHAVTGQVAAGNKLSSEVIRTYHRKMADLGKSSIDRLKFEERHLHSVIIPFNSSRFGEIQRKITDFTLSINDDFGSPDDAECWYGMALHFFRMK